MVLGQTILKGKNKSSWNKDHVQVKESPLYKVMASQLDVKKRTAQMESSFGPLQDMVGTSKQPTTELALVTCCCMHR